MKIAARLITDNDFFCSSLEKGVLVIREKQHIQNMMHDITSVFSFYDYLESMLSSKTFKALAVLACPDKEDGHGYDIFTCKAIANEIETHVIERLMNTVNQLITTLSKLNVITAYACQGTLSLFHLNLGLAFDHLVIADNTLFKNKNVDIGLITKGSGYYLSRLLGVRKATEMLQWKCFSAEDVLHLGLVPRIVPAVKLEEETMRLVEASISGPAANLIDIRRLLKCDINALQRSLELEDLLIKNRLASADFKQMLAKRCRGNND